LCRESPCSPEGSAAAAAAAAEEEAVFIRGVNTKEEAAGIGVL